jgi:hypothetical protein
MLKRSSQLFNSGRSQPGRAWAWRPWAMVALASLGTACASGNLSYRVEDEALAGLNPERQAHLAQLSASLETARAGKSKAEKDLALATYELDTARTNQQLIVDRIGHMNGLKDAAEKLGDATRVADAQHVIDGLEALRDAHEEEIEWLEAEVSYYEVGVELGQARVDVADAQLEAARAEAVHQQDLPAKAEIALEEYKVQVSEKMSDASKLEHKSAVAWKEVQDEKKEFQEALAEVPDDESAEKKALAAEANKNREMADEMNALRKQIDKLRTDNQRLQTTLAGQSAGGGEDPNLNPGGGAVKASAGGDSESESD